VRKLRDIPAARVVLDPRCLDLICNSTVEFPIRWKTVDRIKRVDVPVLTLGCLAACVCSPTWQKVSRLGRPFPLVEMLRAASTRPKRGIFWRHWFGWAYAQSGATSQRAWAAMIDRRTTNRTLWGGQVTVNLVHRWLSGTVTQPAKESLEEAFQGWACSAGSSGRDRFLALAEWRFLYLLVFNLELTLSQWSARDKFRLAEIKTAFGQAIRMLHYFGCTAV
jgi:hypothetical protein